MFAFLRRPKLTAHLVAPRAVSDEFARRMDLGGRLVIRNAGSDADLTFTEMMVITGFRRIPLAVPPEWGAVRITSGRSGELELNRSLTLDAPLRSPAGELYVVALDQRRRKWEWRLPFTFEQR